VNITAPDRAASRGRARIRGRATARRAQDYWPRRRDVTARA